MRLKLFIASLFVAFICGCGYTTSSTLPAHLKTIHIGHFKNKIQFTAESSRNNYLPLIEVDSRNAVINRFQFDGNLKITDSEIADLVLEGELKSYSRGALRYTDDEDVQEYRVTVTMSLTMWDRQKNDYAWVEPSFSGEGTYFVTGSQASTEEDALREAIDDLAKRIVERTVEDW